MATVKEVVDYIEHVDHSGNGTLTQLLKILGDTVRDDLEEPLQQVLDTDPDRELSGPVSAKFDDVKRIIDRDDDDK